MSGDLDVLEPLRQEPWRYDFFSALTLVESAFLPASPLGTAGRLTDDPIRLGQHVSLGFESAMVKRFIPRGEKTARLEVTFFGLLGPNAPMPLHLSEEAYFRLINQKDPSLAHFLDIFHHRLLTVLYRAWSQARAGKTLADFLSALTGTQSRPPALAAERWMNGEFIEQRRSRDGLRRVMREAFDLAAEVTALERAWWPLAADDRPRLGSCGFTPGIALGGRVCGAQHNITMTLRPLDFAAYRRCLPGEAQFAAIVSVVRRYVGESFSWRLNLTLPPAQRPAWRLGAELALGYATWLGKAGKREGAACSLSALRFYS
ncbi:type VI secretion system baseplate subunit TssG [Pantoea sp. LS15]|uniref:type VI secretion system baseplate subunit TssG n=1 Tax=Enterobacterales TaxID=91347 RepID=UPI000E0F8EDA|nr:MULTISPECIES: type VI secretion system baseplate subunit TssG [Enterobacterales]NJQ21798.1 type VI secretion system baseplate subunit TssG [Pantoea sp. LS15]NKF48394.1 type VI secretion system baseplate subunit TssG [Pantoea sp. LS15]RDK12952.1 type VI secretion system baseplate subunit TssG [Enterobacter sp. 9-2]